ncbi:MAG: DUF1573 domain-containing protein [Candidatus Omnitrophota bacterium]
MRVFYRISLIILFFVYLVTSSQFLYAQNIDGLKLEIYSKLRDRRCTTMTLEKCNCPDAREMKAYIDALIEAGINKDEIFYKVAKKFSPNTILDKQIKAQVEARLIKEAGGKRPQIVLEPSSINLGQVSKKQGKIEKVFKLYNKGTAKLIITNIKVSCSCVTTSLTVSKNKSPYFGTQGAPSGWQVVIEPGQSGELEVVVDLSHPAIAIGKLIRDINITNNDIINPEVTIRIKANIIE